MEHTLRKYTGIKRILSNQVKNKSNLKWAWRRSEKNEEFVCVYNVIPSWSTELYTASQLLVKLDESNSSI